MEEFKLNSIVNKLKKLVRDYLVEYIRSYPPSNLQEKQLGLSNGKEINIIDYKTSDYLFKIGNVEIKNPIISAPLAGISDNTYRIFAKFFGSALTFTEMIASYGIYYRHKKSLALTDITEFERPCVLQIFGSNPEIMAEAAKRVEDKADIIDINMGCPVPKILRSGSGGFLLKDQKKVEKIILKVVKAVKKPVSVKVRIGWNRDNINIIDIAKIVQGCGAGAIFIHGRTVKQGFSGEVDYGVVRKVKDTISIPVIVSGDIDSPQKALEVLKFTGCDGAMIGRAARGSIWLFLNIFLSIANMGGLFENSNGIQRKIDFTVSLSWRKE
ncbi:MAG: tRNA-dihydrouridine synthase, partial [Actinobacteria bacterium]|nr:tRNA-dihydrouridine synthase [Actinomycetota bacterium]